MSFEAEYCIDSPSLSRPHKPSCGRSTTRGSRALDDLHVGQRRLGQITADALTADLALDVRIVGAPEAGAPRCDRFLKLLPGRLPAEALFFSPLLVGVVASGADFSIRRRALDRHQGASPGGLVDDDGPRWRTFHGRALLPRKALQPLQALQCFFPRARV
jgi:hypothetical protein